MCRLRLTWAASLSIVRRLHGGAVAQLGERLVRNEEVSGSIPLSSTTAVPSVQLRDFIVMAMPSARLAPRMQFNFILTEVVAVFCPRRKISNSGIF